MMVQNNQFMIAVKEEIQKIKYKEVGVIMKNIKLKMKK